MRTRPNEEKAKIRNFIFLMGMTKFFKRLILPAIIALTALMSCSTRKSRIAWAKESEQSQISNVHTIPVHKRGKLILIEGQAIGVSGYFIFDTGAPGLVLNEVYFTGQTMGTKREVTGVNGQIHQAKMKDVYDLKLGEVNFRHQVADVVDLRHI